MAHITNEGRVADALHRSLQRGVVFRIGPHGRIKAVNAERMLSDDRGLLRRYWRFAKAELLERAREIGRDKGYVDVGFPD